ncbi:MAG: hypothetical protein GY745_17325 [Actinomycetia bacterium]|nr:hypothetical protein [Actinomycetes bacterium]MCP3911906.1 hypothetical protein [Actinomycetes bacterium]MCP4086795.1 hypothetical protein [Actinomycetes bacterium]
MPSADRRLVTIVLTLADLGAGATVLHPPIDQPWGRSARYSDLDGNTVELTQPGDEPT